MSGCFQIKPSTAHSFVLVIVFSLAVFGKHLIAATFFLRGAVGKEFVVRTVQPPDKHVFLQTCLSGLNFMCQIYEIFCVKFVFVTTLV